MSMITTQDLERLQREQGKWQEPPKTHDTRQLAECLWATFSAPAFNHCIQPGRFVEAFTGPSGYVELFCALHTTTTTYDLIRKPPKSKAQLSSRRLNPDVPGLYVVRITLDKAWTQDVGIAVFPREVEKRLNLPDADQAYQRRMRLRSIVRDRRVTPETIVDSLEGDDPMFGMGGRIVGGGRPLPPGSSVNGATSTAFSVSNYHTQ